MKQMNESAPDLVAVCDAAAVDEGEVLRVDTDGVPPLAVYKVDGDYFVTADTCTHGEASLSEGFVEGATVECPWHNGKFCIRTGAALDFPAIVALQTWPVTLVGGKVCIRLTPAAATEPAPKEGTSCRAN
jgi:nitrite reductase/ring-hydroxylating ferredoxin subunit